MIWSVHPLINIFRSWFYILYLGVNGIIITGVNEYFINLNLVQVARENVYNYWRSLAKSVYDRFETLCLCSHDNQIDLEQASTQL